MAIPKKPFQRLVREIVRQMANGTGKDPYRFQAMALDALQESVEAFMSTLFQDANLCAKHARRVTVMTRDFKLALRIRGEGHLFTIAPSKAQL